MVSNAWKQTGTKTVKPARLYDKDWLGGELKIWNEERRPAIEKLTICPRIIKFRKGVEKNEWSI